MTLQEFKLDAEPFAINLCAGEAVVIAFSSFNSVGEKDSTFDFGSFLKQDAFSTVLVRDINNTWYHGPIASAEWGVGALCERLRAVTRSHRRIVCLGASMGGYAALMFGSLLGASRVLAFSPQVNLDETWTRHIGDQRWINNLIRINAETRNTDLLDLSGHHFENAEIFLDPNDALDMQHAALLQPKQNVSVHELPGFGHNVAEGLRSIGALRSIIADATDRVPAGGWRTAIYANVQARRELVSIEESLFNNTRRLIRVAVRLSNVTDGQQLHAALRYRFAPNDILWQTLFPAGPNQVVEVEVPTHKLEPERYCIALQILERGLLHDRIGIEPAKLHFEVYNTIIIEDISNPGRHLTLVDPVVPLLASAGGHRLGTIVGEKRYESIHVERAGCALFGCYATLPAGDYKARILFRGEIVGIARLEIYGPEGVIAGAVRLDANCQSIRFRLTKQTDGVETRLFSEIGFLADITGVLIEADAPPAEAPSKVV